jgi:tetratricopeptide (TPR) repeat protein
MDELYWTGRWDETAEAADEIVVAAETGPGPIQRLDARILRARVRLARGDIAGALDDSKAAADVAREAAEPQVTFPALATRAHVLQAAGKQDEADAVASELLASWEESGATLPGSWLPELATVLVALERGSELADAAERVATPTRWLEAASAFAAGEPGRAARIYAEIGSLPDEAYARLKAAESLLDAGQRDEAQSELALALDFYSRVGATGYLREAETLLAST